MAFFEALAPLLEGGAEAGGEAGAEGGGGLGGMGKMGGMMPDFNDSPVKKIEGAAFGAIGTHGGDQAKVNIGPIGTIA